MWRYSSKLYSFYCAIRHSPLNCAFSGYGLWVLVFRLITIHASYGTCPQPYTLYSAYPSGCFRLLYRVFYRCILAPSSGNVFHYLWLRCYTDCGCLDLRHLCCNINSSILQHQEILSLLSSRTYATPGVV